MSTGGSWTQKLRSERGTDGDSLEPCAVMDARLLIIVTMARGLAATCFSSLLPLVPIFGPASFHKLITSILQCYLMPPWISVLLTETSFLFFEQFYTILNLTQ